MHWAWSMLFPSVTSEVHVQNIAGSCTWLTALYSLQFEGLSSVPTADKHWLSHAAGSLLTRSRMPPPEIMLHSSRMIQSPCVTLFEKCVEELIIGSRHFDANYK